MTHPTDQPTQSNSLPPATIDSSAPPATTEKSNGAARNAHAGPGSDAEVDPSASNLDAIPPVAAAKATKDLSVEAAAPAQRPRVKHETLSGSLRPTRRPPSTPVLLPECRYCYKDGFVKPLRAHHCRSCGTCVLRFDHHCPWIGQCVGALNHRFFFIFCEWAAIFCIWVFATLLAQNVKAGNSTNLAISPDGQQIAVIALAGLFMLFTLIMIASHTRLIIHNQTTIENLGVQRMKEREKAILGNAFPWYQFGAKRRMRKQWDEEWGSLGREGNLWWLGSYRANWESVMGSSVIDWFLPIGRSPMNGLEYRTNPRFDEIGRWRPRREWPEGLR